MMVMEDVTIVDKDMSTINGMTCDIKPQSILLIKSSIDSERFTKSLIGKKPISDGKIYIKKNFVESNQVRENPFFLISSNTRNYWADLKLNEIAALVSRNSKMLSGKNKFSTRKYFAELSTIQKLKFLLEIGEYLNRKIYIFENPVENLDYQEIEDFKQFVLNELTDKNYIIIDRKLNEVYKSLEIPVYYF